MSDSSPRTKKKRFQFFPHLSLFIRFFCRWATKLWSSPWSRAYQMYCSTWIHKRDQSPFPKKPLCLQSGSDVCTCAAADCSIRATSAEKTQNTMEYYQTFRADYNTSLGRSHWHAFETMHEENAKQGYDAVRFLGSEKKPFLHSVSTICKYVDKREADTTELFFRFTFVAKLVKLYCCKTKRAFKMFSVTLCFSSVCFFKLWTCA